VQLVGICPKPARAVEIHGIPGAPLREIPDAGLVGRARFWIHTRRFLRSLDLLVVSGGGQLDEYWGGPRAHPFTLAAWTRLAHSVGVPIALLSVGADVVRSPLTRVFLRTALPKPTIARTETRIPSTWSPA
jgi:hypothetical protein